MSWIFAACVGIAFVWIALFYLWGRSFLMVIRAEADMANSIAFGYLILQVVYQVIYLPFFLNRGSYRATVYIWMGIVAVGSVGLVFYLNKCVKTRMRMEAKEKVVIVLAGVSVFILAVYISLHVPFYGSDTVNYITTMNDAYYRDSLWINKGVLSVHHGLCSMFHFFTISSLLTGIVPYYTSLFTVRVIGVFLFALVLYWTGVIVFKKKGQVICWPALALAILVPILLMFWGSNYTAEFFYWRINEAKGYCQFVLLPLGFAIFLGMFKENTDRKTLWKEQLLVSLAAIPISTSSMTAYLFLLLMGTCAVLAYDKLKFGGRTICQAAICAMPNLFYLALYILENKQIVVF